MMRRQDRAILDLKEQIGIIEQCKVCRVAVQDEAGLYIVPMNFGYQSDNGRLTLYFHSAGEGRKVKAFGQSAAVAFEMDCGHRLIESETACEYSYAFQSVIGSGVMHKVDDVEEKKNALSLLMKHQSGKVFAFDDEMAKTVLVFRLDADSYSVKHRK